MIMSNKLFVYLMLCLHKLVVAESYTGSLFQLLRIEHVHLIWPIEVYGYTSVNLKQI